MLPEHASVPIHVTFTDDAPFGIKVESSQAFFPLHSSLHGYPAVHWRLLADLHAFVPIHLWENNDVYDGGGLVGLINL